MTTPYEEKVLRIALRIAEQQLRYTAVASKLTSPENVVSYLRIWAANLTEEAFGVIWLTAQHQVIKAETLFHGSIDGASVYPRVLVRQALKHNAAAAILFHNHPSGGEEPSNADRTLTARLKEALNLIEVRILDHMTIGRNIASMAELGWL